MIRHIPRSGMLAIGCLAAFGATALAAGPLDKFVPKRVEADPNEDYTLTETNGPWLILATTFTGDGAKEQARRLVLELRAKHKLPAYLYQKKFDFSKSERGRGVDRYGAPLKMRYQRGNEVVEIAVLVGDYPDVGVPDAKNTLKKIKYLTPETLDPAKNKKTSQTLATVRAIQKSWLSDESEQKKKGPMGSAFIITNPLLPNDYFAPKGLDKFVVKINSDVKHSLLNCRGKYTVKVATFSGQVVLDQEKIEKIEKGAKFKSRLEVACDNAHAMCEALRAKGVEAYEFHDRYMSIVTIGSFDSVGQPRPDGKIEINPAIHAIMLTYGREVKQAPGKAKPELSKPKTITVASNQQLSFDISPIPVEVPRRSIAADYQHTTTAR